MLFDIELVKLLCLVFGVVIAAGLVVLFVMKKLKKPERAVTVVTIAVIFAGVMLAGFLVYWVSIGMMMDMVQEMKP